MEQYLIDTNTISYYLSASLSEKSMNFIDAVIDAVPKISVTSQIELLSWETDKLTQKTIGNFISESFIHNITPDIVAHYVTLRKKKKM